VAGYLNWTKEGEGIIEEKEKVVFNSLPGGGEGGNISFVETRKLLSNKHPWYNPVRTGFLLSCKDLKSNP
jgi:hypothetical protein